MWNRRSQVIIRMIRVARDCPQRSFAMISECPVSYLCLKWEGEVGHDNISGFFVFFFFWGVGVGGGRLGNGGWGRLGGGWQVWGRLGRVGVGGGGWGVGVEGIDWAKCPMKTKIYTCQETHQISVNTKWQTIEPVSLISFSQSFGHRGLK